MTTQHYDEDGDCITLTDEDREGMLAEIKALETELMGYCSDPRRHAELIHRRLHLVDELVEGRRLPLCDE